MFRMWCKLYKNNRMLRDTTISDDSTHNRTRKVFDALQSCCHEFDLATPIWMDATIKEFKRNSKCRFTKDNFMEAIDFDYLELQVLEEDDFIY